MSQNFVYTPEGDALEYFTSFWKPKMQYEEVKHRMQRAYNSPAMQAIIKSEMDSLDIDRFVRSKDISDPRGCARSTY